MHKARPGARGHFDYRIKLAARALRDTSSFIGWNRQSLVFPFLLAGGFGFAWWFFGVERAVEELALTVAFGLAPLGGFAVLLFIWNAWLAPGRLYREQANELDRLKLPEFPPLSMMQRKILALCDPPSEETEYMMTGEAHGVNINHKPLKDQQAGYYSHTQAEGHLKHMATKNIVEIITDKTYVCGFRFRLTRLGVQMAITAIAELGDKLGVGHGVRAD